VLIFVSAPGDGKTNNTGPVDAVNKNLKTALGLPSGYSAVAVVRIGKVEKVDAVTAASSRKKVSDVVNYKK
jgi:hypothetical protein